jgi:heterodisulfide reductase subunit C2
MKADPELVSRLRLGGAFDASVCMNCGVCTALCPLGMEIFPRRLFRLVLLGDAEGLRAESDTIFSCLLCRMCESQCPAGVHITENVRALRTHLNREQYALAEA